MADNNDQFANFLASYNDLKVDEINNALASLSAVVSQYYRLLIKSGVPADKAVILTGALQNAFLTNNTERKR